MTPDFWHPTRIAPALVIGERPPRGVGGGRSRLPPLTPLRRLLGPRPILDSLPLRRVPRRGRREQTRSGYRGVWTSSSAASSVRLEMPSLV